MAYGLVPLTRQSSASAHRPGLDWGEGATSLDFIYRNFGPGCIGRPGRDDDNKNLLSLTQAQYRLLLLKPSPNHQGHAQDKYQFTSRRLPICTAALFQLIGDTEWLLIDRFGMG